ncbi:aspartate aminotransferase family protein [Sphingobium sp.]|uniref:aspartate aminotransferase family protein n=1 Tax=Sphingobium sp. TaxID=1912891 RepID=UPI002C2FED60|nr:aminotransferase class III-fold pyridoxal phosphate-dependent enzyme [Sphingobium sp.]HUD93446.1 aminotransferase class III-fold pyridoxal phosphate-dependent enzyme [Sphingobium sp.]
MATQIREDFRPVSTSRTPDLLTLDEAVALDMGRANQLYARHLNRHLLQIYAILGLDMLDVRSAEGTTLHLADGRRVLDFSTGMGAAGLGHNHPRILAAERLCHERRLLDITKLSPHKLQAALAHNLAQILPDPLDTSFLATSGAEANEAAMKLAERIQTPKGKQKFLCMQGAFHGKTHGALSLTTATQVHTGFLLGVPRENVIYIPYGDIDALQQAIANASMDGQGNDIIAAIIEPIRGTACEVPPPGYLSQFVRLCRDNDIISSFDEVKVGCGRTGRFCAFMHEDTVPDVVTLAKTLGGGKRAIGAMVTSQALFDRAYGNRNDCNLHSSTFSGIGETCAVAIETLNTLYDDGLIDNAAEMGDYLEARLEGLRIKYPGTLVDVRGRGLFRAIRLNFREDLAARLVDVSTNPLFLTYQTVLIGAVARMLFERHNILVHFQPGARDILHFMPPFTVTKVEIDQLVDGLDEIFDRGIADSALRFVAGNVKRLLSGMRGRN